jgi:hypothetical protein
LGLAVSACGSQAEDHDAACSYMHGEGSTVAVRSSNFGMVPAMTDVGGLHHMGFMSVADFDELELSLSHAREAKKAVIRLHEFCGS